MIRFGVFESARYHMGNRAFGFSLSKHIAGSSLLAPKGPEGTDLIGYTTTINAPVVPI